GLELNDPERYTLQVIQAILAGQGGRLFVELRDKASLAYSVSPMRMEGLEGGYFGAYIGCSPEKAGKALAMMKEEFRKLCESGVGEAELARAQRYLIGKHDIELQKNSNITSAILFDEIYGIDYMETYRFSERIRAVNAGSIRKLATRLFARPR
ncbi:MAG: insulinase family protein, partial [Calothrix sp. SM1_5_4]|nr:insulinase family protein [Calothrix sp. SM1_5_4]